MNTFARFMIDWVLAVAAIAGLIALVRAAIGHKPTHNGRG